MSESDLTYPGSPYHVLAHDPGGRPPELPGGHGAVAVHTWCPPAAERYTLAPIVGVDGEPASYGWGHALIVLPAGQHLVEVQYIEPIRTVPVTITAGQIVPVEYAAAPDGTSPGTLGEESPGNEPGGRLDERLDEESGGRRRRGRGFNPVGYGAVILATLAVYEAGLALARHLGLSPRAGGAVVGGVVIAGAVLGGIAVHRYQQRPARRSGRRSGQHPTDGGQGR